MSQKALPILIALLFSAPAALAAFGKPDPVKLEGHHSVVLKYDGKDSFAKLCQKLQSR